MWSAWMEGYCVSNNFKPCGNGKATKKRIRTCTNPKPAYGGDPCSGETQKMEDCTLVPCPRESFREIICRVKSYKKM